MDKDEINEIIMFSFSFQSANLSVLAFFGISGTIPEMDTEPSGLVCNEAPGGNFLPPTDMVPSEFFWMGVPGGSDPKAFSIQI